MLALLLSACSKLALEDCTDRHHEPRNSDTHSTSDGISTNSTPAEQGAPCPQRTDQRTGNGAITLTLELDKPETFTLRPVTGLTVEDTYTVPNTHVLGYNPETGAELFVGEQAVLYYCDTDFWFYWGDLDVNHVMDSRGSGLYHSSQRMYNEDSTLRETRQVDFRIRVTGLVFRQ
ncbi:MAG: hypothetical protein AAB558_01150 [Patescibacteria group bacterium]